MKRTFDSISMQPIATSFRPHDNTSDGVVKLRRVIRRTPGMSVSGYPYLHGNELPRHANLIDDSSTGPIVGTRLLTKLLPNQALNRGDVIMVRFEAGQHDMYPGMTMVSKTSQNVMCSGVIIIAESTAADANGDAVVGVVEGDVTDLIVSDANMATADATNYVGSRMEVYQDLQNQNLTYAPAQQQPPGTTTLMHFTILHKKQQKLQPTVCVNFIKIH